MIDGLNAEVAILGFSNIWTFLLGLLVAILIGSVIIGGIIFEIYDIIRGIVRR